jgi:two-component system cell cycle sensor histidine kinase/response regulator CckA
MDEFFERMKTILDGMPTACMLHDCELRYTYWNRAAEKTFEYDFEEIRGRHPFEVIALPAGAPAGNSFRVLITEADAQANCVSENRTKDGRILTCEWSSVAFHDSGGALIAFLSTCQDLTERKLLEEQLRQAQKMESMALLVGGIAHDFNNLLTVIGGYSRMLMRDIDPQLRAYHHAELVADAADRAASLTSQLLAFSRRQVVQPVIVDLNAVVSKMEKLLRRILGEDVDLRTTLGFDIGAVKIDRAQIEQILMNLVVNSRWAMPEGGRLLIETANAVLDREYRHGRFACPPGNYVLLSVSDTGHGMDDRTRERIFEPFFTTKATGEGTGLGLATVYGIVEKSGGYILVYSEPGSGTTFKIYFPRSEEEVPIAAPPLALEEKASVGTILLVEDEAQVLETVSHMLTRQGYTVLEASGCESAREICRGYPDRIDLLLTDVVLRSGNGPDLARELCALRPDLPVIFMSGYADHFLLRSAIKNSGAAFLQKPFTPRSLQSVVQTTIRQAAMRKSS